MSGARQYLSLPGRFEMRQGGYLESPVIAYETWGELNAARDNAVLIGGNRWSVRRGRSIRAATSSSA